MADGVQTLQHESACAPNQAVQRSCAALVSWICCLRVIPLCRLRYSSLLLAILVYGFWGAPTPETIGFAEIIVALLLIFAVNAQGIISLLKYRPGQGEASWLASGRWLLVYGTSVPVVVAVLQGHSVHLMIRDLIALAFIGLPVLLAPLIQEQENSRSGGFPLLLIVCVVAGIMLAARDIAGIMHFQWPILLAGERLSYLSNSPLVLMAAVMLGGYGIFYGLAGRCCRSLILAIICFSVMCIPFWTMGLTLQRASLGLFVVSMFILFGAGLVVRPFRAGILLAMLLTAVIYAVPPDADIISLLWQKSMQVGLNMRTEELQAVWDNITELNKNETDRIDIIGMLFGLGWGATFQSPAVGMMQVNFTHGLIGSALLKTGIIGLVLYGFYLFCLGKAFIAGMLIGTGEREGDDNGRYSLRDWIVLMALICPFLIDVFLYAAFKSFDFGLILLLMAIIARRNSRVEADALVKTVKVS